MSSVDFRNALGCFTTGVCLVTVNDSRTGSLALTANSFSSVSLEPPLVLWSIQNNSECFREYTECEAFGISVLCVDQELLSSHYARKDNHAVRSADFEYDAVGLPLLRRSAARFSCRRWGLHEAGDHHIIVGEVVDFSASSEAPLLFNRGTYGQLAAQAG